MVKSTNIWDGLLVLEFHACHLIVMCLWGNYPISLRLSFLTPGPRIIIVFISLGLLQWSNELIDVKHEGEFMARSKCCVCNLFTSVVETELI